MRRTFKAAICAALLLAALPACAQQANNPVQTTVGGAAVNRSTLNGSVVIATGNTFQTVLASNFNTAVQRQQLTINNNNATDSCWVFLGAGTASKGTSILLLAGASYRREWPYVPSDTIQATCTTTNDTLYVDTQ